MKLGFKRLLKRGQKGVTLVELMVVMAVLAVLASIIFPAVSGTQEVSVDSQTKQDASTLSNAINDFFADQRGAEVVETGGVPLYGSSPAITTNNETISSRWPENYVTSEYANVFTCDNVTSIRVDGAEVTKLWVEARTAIDFDKVGDGGAFMPSYIPATPKSAGDESNGFNNYLWLARKTTASGGVPDASRQLEVWKLVGVAKTASGNSATFVLTYEQIY